MLNDKEFKHGKEFKEITLRGPGVRKAFDAARTKRMAQGWLRITHMDRGGGRLNGEGELAVWVIMDRYRRVLQVGTSTKVGDRLRWLQSRVGWTFAAVSTKGEVELRAWKLARRFGTTMPRDRNAVERMRETKAGRGTALGGDRQQAPPRPKVPVEKSTGELLEDFLATMKELGLEDV